jgi:hypothetical protein
MKQKYFKIFSKGVFALLFVFFIISCKKEVGPIIEPCIPCDSSLLDTSYIVSPAQPLDNKNVLIEDFTGVRCPNCPRAATKIHELDSIYSQQSRKIIPVAIHSSTGSFGQPHPGQEDYRIDEGIRINTMLNGKGIYPIGDVDRKKYPTESDVLVNFSTWSAYVSQQMAETPKVNIHLSVYYKPDSSNMMKVRVEVHYNVTSTDTNYLSVAILENNIISPQTLPNSSVDTHYVHMHILRDMFTPYNGVKLNASFIPGRVFIKEFKLPFKSNWNADNCVIVAFVHNRDSKFDVLQAEEIDLK